MQPGDACTTAAQVALSGGPEISGGHMLVCNGANWVSIVDYADTGSMLTQVGYDSGACDASKDGRIRYVSAGSPPWEFCDGAAWSALGGGLPTCADGDLPYASAGGWVCSSDAFNPYNVSVADLRTLGESLALLPVSNTNVVKNGGALTVNGQSLGGYDYVVIDGDVSISSGWAVGDYFSDTADSKSAVVVVKGDLTINSGAVFTPSARKLFTFIYVTGDLTVNGEISMTARGADHSAATGSNIAAAPIRIAQGTYSGVNNPEVPAAGGAGGAAKTTNSNGDPGSNGSSGGSGGGGSGSRRSSGTSGAGAAGTSFSGGPAGGGAAAATAIDGASDGGLGGNGVKTGGGAWGAGGGAGNPGGSGNGGTAGSTGTGGTLIGIVLGQLSGSGDLTADGTAGGTADGSTAGAAGGGGSGGGSNTWLYGTDSSSIIPTANGGAGGTSYYETGGDGGDGTARKLAIP